MSRVCQVTGKRPVQTHRFWVESEKRFVKLRLTAKGMRIIDKKGIDAVLADMRANGENV